MHSHLKVHTKKTETLPKSWLYSSSLAMLIYSDTVHNDYGANLFLTVSCSNTKGGAVNLFLLCTIIIALQQKCLVADNSNSIFNVYHARVLTAQDWEVIDHTV